MINVQKMIKEERKKEANKKKDNLDLCIVELKKIVDKINDEIGMAMIYNTYNVTTESVVIRDIYIDKKETKEFIEHIKLSNYYSCLADFIPVDNEYFGAFIKFKHEKETYRVAKIDISDEGCYLKVYVKGSKMKIEQIEVVVRNNEDSFISIILK